VLEQPQRNQIGRLPEAQRKPGKITRNWRYVVGTFAVRIPVTTRAEMLPLEENTLAIMKWKLTLMAPTNRWYPVLQRYISYIVGRVQGLGGDPGGIEPSPSGYHPKPISGETRCEHTGKVSGIVYDRFGDFRGFCLLTECGEEREYWSRENEIEALVRFAWRERIVISVVSKVEDPFCPVSIILRRAPIQPRPWE
jgi:hypothetical protein